MSPGLVLTKEMGASSPDESTLQSPTFSCGIPWIPWIPPDSTERLWTNSEIFGVCTLGDKLSQIPFFCLWTFRMDSVWIP